MKVEIAIAYHKEAEIFKNDALLPMQVGKVRSDIDLGIIGDDTGSNISLKNIWYAELTATYWLWKNSNAEIKGLFHYRRFLNLNKDCPADRPAYEVDLESIETPDDFVRDMDLQASRVSEILNDNFLITRCREDLHSWSKYSMASHFKAMHIAKHLDMAMEIVKTDFPAIYPVAVKTLRDHYIYATNIVIMKSADFDNYCKFIFGVLNKLEKQVNPYDREIENGGQTKKRFAAMLGERLTSIYIEYIKSTGKKIAEFPAVTIVPRGTLLTDASTYAADAYAKNNEKSGVIIHNLENPEKPKVSVCIAAYNVKKHIGQAVTSVTKQTLQNIEMIIINDGSSDNTLGIIRKLAQRDSRIRIVNQENGGLGNVRNVSIAQATGEYVHFMDGDDFMDADFLESMVKNADKYASDIVISNHRIIEDRTNKLLGESYLPFTLYGGHLNVKKNIDLLMVPCHVWDKIFRRASIGEIKFWDKPGTGEDVYFWWQIIMNVKNVSICSAYKYNYRVSPTSVQQNPKLVIAGFAPQISMQKMITEQYGEKSEVAQMYDLSKQAIIGHMVERVRLRLVQDKEFKAEFCAKAIAYLNTGNVEWSPAIESKKEFFYTNFARIRKLKSATGVKEFAEILHLTPSPWAYVWQFVLSKVTFGQTRKRHKEKRNKYYQGLVDFVNITNNVRGRCLGLTLFRVKKLPKPDGYRIFLLGIPFITRNALRTTVLGITVASNLDSYLQGRFNQLAKQEKANRQYLQKQFDYVGWKVNDVIPQKIDKVSKMLTKKVYPKSDRKSVLVVGNGPSLADIDYRRMPKDIDVWRVNDFFFEREYYVGRKVDAYFTHNLVMERQYINLNLLQARREYDINFNNFWTKSCWGNLFKRFPHIANLYYDFLEEADLEFSRLKCFCQQYFSTAPSTGMSVLFVAAAMGYENIYTVGMDLHIINSITNDKMYSWGTSNSTPYFRKIYDGLFKKYNPGIQNPFVLAETGKEPQGGQPVQTQLEFINLLLKRPNINLYSVAEKSPLSQYVPLAPFIEDDVKSWAGYVPEKKTEGATVDWPEFPQFDEPLLAEMEPI